MNHDITSYLKIYPIFDRTFCAEIIAQLDSSTSWEQHVYADSRTHEGVSFTNEFLMSFDDIPNTQKVMQGIWNAYKAYCEDLSFSWFNSWVGYTSVRFNKYLPATEMQEHCDHIKSIFDGDRKGVPVLTALGALNDDYEGGELIFWQDKQILIPPGCIAVFPSNFLYPHKVLPVTSGSRYSFVSWAW